MRVHFVQIIQAPAGVNAYPPSKPFEGRPVIIFALDDKGRLWGYSKEQWSMIPSPEDPDAGT